MTKISNQYSLTNVLTADVVNGRVGINNGSPTVALDVTGAGKFSTTVTAQTGFKLPANGNGTSPTLAYNNSLGFGVSGTGIFFGNLYNSDLSTAIQLRVTNSGGTDITALTIDSRGFLGIGTTSPSEQVTLSRSVYPTVKLIETTDNAQGYFQYHSENNYFILNAQSNHPLLFGTNDTERMRITSGGNVLIGTTSSNGSTVQINGSAYANLFRINDTNGGFVTLNMSNLERWSINYLARFASYGAGTLTTDGSGNITASSDITLKNIIKPIKNVLENIKDFEPVYFKWNEKTDLDKENVYMSTIAQSIQKHYPEAVGKMEDGTLTVQDRAVTAILVAAIQEQQTQINELKALINA